MRRPLRALLSASWAVVCLGVAATSLAAQGITTASVRGRVLDEQGAPVERVTVVLLNTSTGQRFRSVSRAGGHYNIENAAVGGPYVLSTQMIGFQPVRRTGITLSLGQVLELNVDMARAAVQLGEIIVTPDEQNPVFSRDAQGTSLSFTDSSLRRLPTLDRDFQDFVRLTPQVAERDEGGVSVSGQNNRFNTIQVDGSTVNDRFGLGRTGQTGGQAGGRAVGLEAVKEYEVLLAPYDVRQGNFTGALINAVTKSGTNELHGSAFWYFRNQGLAGDPLGLTDFRQHQFGASVGGPIQRDKTHFFLNGEFRRRSTPAGGPYVGQPVSLGTVRASQADIDAFNAALGAYGVPATGIGGLITNTNPLNNLLARVDYELSGTSRLVFRYIFNTAQDDIFNRSTGTTFDLSSTSYHFKSQTHNPSLQFFTSLASGASNELLFSLNRIRDKRTPDVTAPLIIVQNFTAADGSGLYSLQSGSERFSQGNELDQDIWELTDNFTIPVGSNHRITLGTRNELYKVRNLFAQSSYGVWTFDDLADFQNGVVEQYESAGDLGGGIAATFTAGILGAYMQDQFHLGPQVSVTAGLRLDVPMFFDQPTYDPRVASDGFNTEVPSGQLLLSPRLGFNVDLGNRETQIRGGAGIFTGAPAYVWYSNAYSNNGTKLGRITCTGGNVPAFDTRLGGPLQCADGTGIAAGTTIGEVNIIAADTKFPQVLRANLGVDRRLPGNVAATAEFIYTKGINDFFIVNRNLNPSVGTDANGRVMYGTFPGSGVSTPSYMDLTLYGPSFNGGVFELRNTNQNDSWSLTGQLQKRFSGSWEGNLGYTYSRAYDVQSFTSSRAISNWRFGRVYSTDQLQDEATVSSFSRPHRVVAGVTYTFPWSAAQTDLSLSWVGQSGQPYTLIAGGAGGRGDLNADGSNTNDPIYIPNDAAAEMTFVNLTDPAGAVVATPAEQAAALNQYIAGEPCLAAQRGGIMERNSCRQPWQNFLNLTLRQSLPRFGNNNAVSLELGIFNVLNLLNDDWGQIKSTGRIIFFDYGILQARSYDVAAQQHRFTFNPTEVTNRYVSTTSPFNSYQIQLSARYTF
ncbi:MAG TPA: carboxypeptidase regulatory-like domain-containing protein [Gemmatimonadales bacterium]|nr:carboxypeptidase regulatory-like domain-containing protein [Gemmatimonadales bacterium]